MGELLARTFDVAVRDDRAAMSALAPRIDASEGVGDDRWRRPIVWWCCMVLDEPPRDFPGVDWLGVGVDVVRENWLDVVRQRRR